MFFRKLGQRIQASEPEKWSKISMDTFVCPQCGDRMSEIEKRDGRCLSCGALLPFQVGGHVTAAESPERSQPIGEFDASPRHEESQSPPDLALPELKISRGGG